MNPELATKMLNFVQVASILSKRALDELSKKQAAEKKASAMVGTLTGHMIQSGVIDSNQKQAAEQMLSSHDQTMALLKNAVDKIAELKQSNIKKASELGVPEGEPRSNAADPEWSLKSPFVGARSSEKKASDMAFMKGLGLA